MYLRWILYALIFITGLLVGIATHFGKPPQVPSEVEIKHIIERMDMSGFRIERGKVIFYADNQMMSIVHGDTIFFTKDGKIKVTNAELVKFKKSGDVEFRIKCKESTIDRNTGWTE